MFLVDMIPARPADASPFFRDDDDAFTLELTW